MRRLAARMVSMVHALVMLIGVLAASGWVLPGATSAGHPRPIRTKQFVQVEIVAPPHVPGWYVDVLARLVDKRLEDRPLPGPAAALLTIGPRGHEALSLITTTGDVTVDEALLRTVRQAAPLPVLAQTDGGTFRCIVRWSSP